MDLSTTYLGFKLPHPLIPGAGHIYMHTVIHPPARASRREFVFSDGAREA